jgi:hypothetical protein
VEVYVAAIEGHVPADMVRAISAYIDFYYLVRRPAIDTDSLAAIQDAISRYHQYRVAFQTHGVRPFGSEGLSLPRQHAMTHYPELIIAFGAPNGLCSSITEKKHIVAVKKPYRRSGRYRALGHILLVNQRLDKLAAARRDFKHRRMLRGTCADSILRSLNAAQHDDSLSGESDSEVEHEQHEQESGSTPGEVDDEDDDCAPVEGPTILNHVVLARTPGTPHSI